MKFSETALPGVMIVEPRVFADERGFFLESYHAEKYRQGGIDATFVQDNHSRSRRGTLRGLHMQLHNMQGKLCRVVRGEVFDVAVDVRVGSPHFGRSVAVVLSEDNFRQVWIPPGFAHGFLVTSDVAEFQYKCTELYDPDSEISIAWDDPDIGIDWPIAEPTLSAKDAAAPRLAALMDRLPRY